MINESNNYEVVAECMVDMAKEENFTTYAVLFYEDAKNLLKELAMYEETEIDNIDLSEPVNKGYDREFYVVLDKDLHISVEEAWHEKNEYHEACYFRFGDGDTITLIHSDANSKVVDAASGSICFEFEIGNKQKEQEEQEDNSNIDDVDLSSLFIELLSLAESLFGE